MIESFSRGQLIRFWAVYISSTSLVFMLSPMILKAEYQGWMGYLLSFPISLVVAYFAIRIARINPNQSLIKTGHQIVGKWLHFLFLFLFFFYFYSIAVYSMIGYQSFSSSHLIETPRIVTVIVFVLGPLILAQYGLKSIINFADSMFLIVIPIFFFLFFIISPELNYSMSIALITHFDFRKLIDSTLLAHVWFGEIVLFLFLMPHFQSLKKPLKSIAISHIIIILIHLCYWFSSLSLFGPYLAGHMVTPALQLLNHITLKNFLENVEFIIYITSFASLFVKIALLLHICTKIIQDCFRISNSIARFLPVILTSIMLVSISILSNLPSELERYSTYYFLFLQSIPFIPVIYFVIYKIRFSKKHDL